MTKKSRGRKSYLDASWEIIGETLKRTGCQKEAYLSAGLDHSTFYKWIKQNDEFEKYVKDCLDEFRKNQSAIAEGRIQASEKYVQDLLEGKVKKIKERYFYDGKGVLINKEITEETELPPRWVLERYLPPKQTDDGEIVVTVNFQDDSPV